MMKRSRSTARLAALLCLCLGINALESFLLPLISLPVPGIKLGLSNLVILYCICRGNKPEPWILMGTRALISALLFGNPISFWFSLCGGVCSVLAMQLSHPLTKRKFSYITVSVCGSCAFQIGQAIAACILYGGAIFYYTPILLFCGIFTGAIMGLIANLSLPRLKKISAL